MSKLSFAIPSKGRLKEQTEAFLADCGFGVRQIGGERAYQAELTGAGNVQLQLLSAREIAERLIDGSLQVGVTGQDLLEEISPDLGRDAAILDGLGFGGARVVVAVPTAWIDVDTMHDLDRAAESFRARHGRRMVVATKFQNLSRRFFARHGFSAYRLVDSAGATEAAPATGAADLIVDITTTGATLKANHLKILEDGEMLSSEASIVVSLRAEWTGEQWTVLDGLLRRIDARRNARATARIETGRVPDAATREMAAKSCGLRPESAEPGRSFLCPRVQAHVAAGLLEAAGCGPVAVSASDFLYEGDGLLVERAQTALEQKKRA